VLRASDLEGARDNMKVLHPLPRIDEITTDVDKRRTPGTSSRPETASSPARRYWHWF
jgi:aspartate carbamoyltransferase catalytic subunit